MHSPRVKDFSVLEIFEQADIFLERRQSYDGGGLLQYIGYSKNPNEDTAADSWYIVKLTYSGSSLTRYQLPDNGPSFSYVWDDRATYFS